MIVIIGLAILTTMAIGVIADSFGSRTRPGAGPAATNSSEPITRGAAQCA
jgi:hypothetical protein